ncbi:hypothetical protein [Streptomyces sp. NPDC086782]|uniref:hypothetical protein n=1 Tax=Streptomyces sp. NPDC086782 TaxID=3365757 RepID=UPI00382EAE19
MMYPFLASVLFESWAVQYDRPARQVPQEYHALIACERPHLYAPMVPETFRGPKWGQR